MIRTKTLTVTALLLLLAVGAAAQNDICMTSAGGLAGVPVIDGIVDGYTGPGPINNDAGWNGATRWNLSADAGATTAVKFQAGVAGSFLYLSYVIDTPAIGLDDTVALIFSTDGNAAHDWRIFVQPFDVALPPDGSGIVPKAVTYWRDSTTWNTVGGVAQTAAAGTWLVDNVRVSRGGNRWALEIKIPILTNPADAGLITGIYFPDTTFKLWTDVLNAITVNAVTQAPFPSGANAVPGMDTFLTHNTPPAGSWGTASLNDRPACNGVSLAWADIGVELPVNSGTIVQEIKRYPGPFAEGTAAQCDALPDNAQPGKNGPSNTFIARPVNGMATQAKNVTATFRLADWGIPGTNGFDPLGAPGGNGVANNPTPAQSINAGLQGILKATWALTYKQSCQFSFPGRTHQCIEVDLDSNDPATRFKNKSVQKNMNIVPASLFKQSAKISGDQGALPAGESAHRFFLLVDTDQQAPAGGESNNLASEGHHPRGPHFRSDELSDLAQRYPQSNLYAWIVRGYVATGNKLTIRKHKYEIVRHAGDFGYVAVHAGASSCWRSIFRGDGLKREDDSAVYTLRVEPGKAATVETEIEAVEPGGGCGGGGGTGRFRAFLDAGPNFPHGDLDKIADGRLSVNAGLEGFVAPNTSIEGILGYHSFKSPFISSPHIWQLSLNAKQYFGPGPLHFFVNAGAGAYRFDPGSTTKLGGNAGAGVLYDFSSLWGIEGVYNLHTINTSGSNTQFSTVQVGIRHTL
jgi:hypothetical protein